MKKAHLNILKKAPAENLYDFKLEIIKIGSLPLKIVRFLEKIWETELKIRLLENRIKHNEVIIKKKEIEIDLAENELEKDEKRLEKEKLEIINERLNILLNRYKVFHKLLKQSWRNIETGIKQKTGKSVVKLFKGIDWVEENYEAFTFLKSGQLVGKELLNDEDISFLPHHELKEILKSYKTSYPELKDFITRELMKEEDE